LTDNPPGDKADLETMLRMARNGELRIWHSTLIYTEVRPALLEQGNLENYEITSSNAPMVSAKLPKKIA
jgi:hypothetical protein